VHQLVNKDFDSIKMYGTTVKITFGCFLYPYTTIIRSTSRLMWTQNKLLQGATSATSVACATWRTWESFSLSGRSHLLPVRHAARPTDRRAIRTATDLCITVYTSISQTGSRETTLRNGGRVLLAVLNLYVRIKIRAASFDINHSLIDSTQSINRCFNTDASWFCKQVSQQSSP